MRDILFRGKRVNNGEWVEGYYELYNDRCYMNVQTDRLNTGGYPIRGFVEVIPETVGQYTGSKDENDTKIFEGDIVYSVRDAELAVIKWDDFTARFIIEFDGIVTDFDNYYASDLEVVGNIHDNPELLEVAK